MNDTVSGKGDEKKEIESMKRDTQRDTETETETDTETDSVSESKREINIPGREGLCFSQETHRSHTIPCRHSGEDENTCGAEWSLREDKEKPKTTPDTMRTRK
jgi:hypothetical protein